MECVSEWMCVSSGCVCGCVLVDVCSGCVSMDVC